MVPRSGTDRNLQPSGWRGRQLLGPDDGVPKDAAWASRITDVPEATNTGLARRMAGTRTLINTSWSVQRADHGEQPVCMTVALAAMRDRPACPAAASARSAEAT